MSNEQGCPICQKLKKDEDDTIVFRSYNVCIYKIDDEHYEIVPVKHLTDVALFLSRQDMGHLGKALADTIERLGPTELRAEIIWNRPTYYDHARVALTLKRTEG